MHMHGHIPARIARSTEKHLSIHFFIILVSLEVFVPVQSEALRCVRRSRYWPADQRSGERLPPAGGNSRKTCGHDGERQDWTGLLQVRRGQREGFVFSLTTFYGVLAAF